MLPPADSSPRNATPPASFLQLVSHAGQQVESTASSEQDRIASNTQSNATDKALSTAATSSSALQASNGSVLDTATMPPGSSSPEPRIKMPAFQIFPNAWQESVESTPISRLQSPEILSNTEWRLSLIADLPKRPGYPNEPDGVWEQDNAPQGPAHANGEQLARDELVPLPLIAADGRGSIATDDNDEPTSHWSGGETKPITLATTTNVEQVPTFPPLGFPVPRQHMPRHDTKSSRVSSSVSRKRPRHLLSGPPHAPPTQRRLVCVRCARTRSPCMSHMPCQTCFNGGHRCEYMRCRFGAGCRNGSCTRLHPGQLEEKEEKQTPVTQSEASHLSRPAKRVQFAL